MKNKYDVIVAGGGPAGWVAAVAAARQKVNVLMIERYGFVGGLATAGLVGPFMKWFNKDEELTKGIFKEFSERMKAAGGMIHSFFDYEIYKKIAMEMLTESRVNLLLHSSLFDAKVKDNKIKHISVLNKDGIQEYKAAMYIDATGDGDLAYKAGVPFEIGRREDGLTQSLTLMFITGGVDFEKAERYYLENKDNFIIWNDDPDEHYFKTGHFCRAGFFKQLHQFQNEGKVDKAIKNIFFIMLPRKGYVVFNTTNVIELSGIKTEDLTKAEIIGRKQTWQVMDLLKTLPGFENSYLVQTATQIGVRETRRILGEYVFTGEDVKQGSQFDDAILRANYGIDIHDPKGDDQESDGRLPEEVVYEIPYRSLVPWKVDNLLIAGRCLSSTHEGQSAARIQPTCMAMGEAAGVAASIAVLDDKSPREIDVKRLQAILVQTGGNLGKKVQRLHLNQKDLEREFENAGIKAGDTLILHSSLKSIGIIDGGAETVINALKNVLTEKGTLVMPTFTFSLIQWAKEPYDKNATPSRVGSITETFRKMEGVLRDNHPTHSIAAWGKHAAKLVDINPDATPCGKGSAFDKLYSLNAKIFMLGTRQDTNTMLHFCEVKAGLEYVQVPFTSDREYEIAIMKDGDNIKEVRIDEVPGCSAGFNNVEKYLRKYDVINDLWIGEARSQLLESKKLFKAMKKIFKKDPAVLLCSRMECVICPKRKAAIGFCECKKK